MAKWGPDRIMAERARRFAKKQFKKANTTEVVRFHIPSDTPCDVLIMALAALMNPLVWDVWMGIEEGNSYCFCFQLPGAPPSPPAREPGVRTSTVILKFTFKVRIT